jgi:hypothetical protein
MIEILVINAIPKPNRSVIKHYLKDESQNEINFTFDPSNQFIPRSKLLARNLLFEIVEEKEIRRYQIRGARGMKNEE